MVIQCNCRVDSALEAITENRGPVVVHSALGNGKSLFLEGLKVKARSRGFDVFFYRNTAARLQAQAELQEVLDSSQKTLVVIEDYPDNLELIKFFALRATDASRLVLSARTLVHDVEVYRLCDALGSEDVFEIELNRLDDREIEWVIEFFNDYGLWGKDAGFGPERKAELIRNTCNGEWHAILLRILKSPDISGRFSLLLESIRGKRDHYELLVSALVMATINKGASFSSLLDLWGVEKIGRAAARKDLALRQLIDFQSAEIRIRSAVAAQFILKSLPDADVVVDVLIKITKKAEGLTRVSSLHEALFKGLTKFSTLQQVLPDRQRNRSVVRFYESIKLLQSGNPHFWLQYAVACTVVEEFDRAAMYFDSAYSLAGKKGWDPYMIDNHYARYLMVRSLAECDAESAMAAFRKARMLIFRQVKSDNNLHYPYRVAAQFAEIFDRFEMEISEIGLGELSKAAKFVLGRIEKLNSRQQSQRYVLQCRDSMEYLLERLKERIMAMNDGTSEEPPPG